MNNKEFNAYDAFFVDPQNEIKINRNKKIEFNITESVFVDIFNILFFFSHLDKFECP
jgi:hypothetical protein